MFIWCEVFSIRIFSVSETKERVVDVCYPMGAVASEDLMYFADKSGSNSGIHVTLVQKMGFVLDMISIFLFLTPSTETFIFWSIVATTKFNFKAMGTNS